MVLSWSARAGLTLVISGLALLVALFVDHINDVFQLMGGTTSAFVCFVLPGFFALKLKITKGNRLETAAVYCLIFGGIAVGVVSTFVTIYNLAQGNDAPPVVCGPCGSVPRFNNTPGADPQRR